MLAELTVCLCCCCQQEEISHCAAGVRWLKYLFELARNLQGAQPLQQQSNSHAGQQQTSSSQQQQQQQLEAEQHSAASCGAGGTAAAATSDDAGASASAAAVNGGGAAAATNGHCSCSNGGEGGSCAELDWVADALQHSSVEAWFHSLIRRHFKGSLKVGTCGAYMCGACMLCCLWRMAPEGHSFSAGYWHCLDAG